MFVRVERDIQVQGEIIHSRETKDSVHKESNDESFWSDDVIITHIWKEIIQMKTWYFETGSWLVTAVCMWATGDQ